MAREAGKAADRLKKENYSVSVLALRFPWLQDAKRIKDFASFFDLVVVTDPSDKSGGMKAELGLELNSLRELHVAVTEKCMNGKELALYAAALLREDRFHRTVDDVKKDRWR
jgi:deoxyxylulose-5-phosphate synthase